VCADWPRGRLASYLVGNSRFFSWRKALSEGDAEHSPPGGCLEWVGAVPCALLLGIFMVCTRDSFTLLLLKGTLFFARIESVHTNYFSATNTDMQ
jgi:hypothetical protein